MNTIIPQTRFEVLASGYYHAQVTDVELVDGMYGPQLKARFEIADGDAAGRVVVGWASAKFSPKSRLFTWANSLLFGGKGIPEQYDLSIADLVERVCFLQLSVSKSESGDFNKIEAVLPPVNGAPASRPVIVEDEVPF